MTDWFERQRRLNDPGNWDDDLDIIDASERVDAARLTAGAPGALDPATAAEVVAKPKTQWVNPYEAILDEVRRTSSYVIMLERQVVEADAQGGAHRFRAGQQVLTRFERERDRLIKVSETAIKLGIAERIVRSVENEGKDIAHVAIAAADRAGLTDEQRRAFLLELAAGFRARQTQAAVEARAVAAS